MIKSKREEGFSHIPYYCTVVGDVSRFMIQYAHVGFLHVPIKIGTSTTISPKS
ncbi:MAG: hypothetical protein ACI8RD_002933, partial [Bacillariaceae sp.]